MRAIVHILLLALTLAACSDQEESMGPAGDAGDSGADGPEDTVSPEMGDSGSQDGSDGTAPVDAPLDGIAQDGIGPSDSADGTSLADLSGTWAEFSVMSAIADVPIVGEVVNETTSLQRVIIAQTGNNLTLTSEVCDLYIASEVTLVQTVFPEAFIDALPVTERPAGISRLADKLAFSAPRFVQLRGVTLDNPETDALPTDPGDERIYDQDGDGHPGMTVRIRGLVDGEVYVIQRAWSIYQGEVISNDSILGLIEWDDEQVVLGSDNPLLESPIDSVPDPDPEHSYFNLVRIDPTMTCDQIVARSEELFGL